MNITLLKNTALTLAITLLAILVSFAVGMAAQAQVLIPAGFPFSLVLILILHLMGRKAGLIGFAVFTIWLGSTYLQTGSPLESVMLLIYIALAAAGLFISPYALALAWLFHPLWDFLPRALPPLMTDLPMACILFDIPIGLYLIWATRSGRLKRFGAPGTLFDREALMRCGQALAVLAALVVFSAVVVMVAPLGLLLWVALPLAAALILALRALGSEPELIAWAVFTGWVGMTYAHGGGMLEALVFFVYVALAAIGVFRTPWALALAWVSFIPWSLVPHPLPAGFESVPPAHILFALPVALYLAWSIRSNRWLSSSPAASVQTV